MIVCHFALDAKSGDLFQVGEPGSPHKQTSASATREAKKRAVEVGLERTALRVIATTEPVPLTRQELVDKVFAIRDRHHYALSGNVGERSKTEPEDVRIDGLAEFRERNRLEVSSSL
jgi:hypothetical protein